MDSFFFRSKPVKLKKRIYGYNNSKLVERTNPSSSSSSTSTRASFGTEKPQLVSDFKTFLLELPLTEKEGQEILVSPSYKKKLVDSNGLPLKVSCFHSGDQPHKSFNCNKKGSSTSRYMYTSPLIKKYYASRKN